MPHGLPEIPRPLVANQRLDASRGGARGGTVYASLHSGRGRCVGTPTDVSQHRSPHPAEEKAMLYTIAAVLLILWLLGLVSGYTIGAFIHVLLVIAVVLLLVQLLSGRRVV